MSKITLTDLSNLQNENTAVNAINNNNAVIEAAFDNTLSRDGTQPNTMGAPLDMNSNHILNLPAPLGATDPVRLQDLTAVNGNVTINAIPPGGTTGQGLKKTSNADYVVGWGSSVSSVGLALPTDFTVTNSPVTNTGTLTGAWAVTPTGTGAVVRATSPALVTPALGTPTALVGTNITGTAAGLTAGNVTTNANLTGVITSVGNATSIASQTGTGTKFVVDTTPTLVTPILGVATATSINKMAITAPATSSTLAVANGKTLTANNTLTLAGTDSTTITFQGTDTYVGKATTDTLTNKTYDTAGTGNSFLNGGVAMTRGQYPAVNTNTSATAGNIGEYIESITAAAGITNGVAANVTSISLTAGDWDVNALTYFIGTGTTSFTNIISSLSLVSATIDATAGRLAQTQGAAFVPANGAPYSSTIGSYRFLLSGTTTIFLVCLAQFTVSTCQSYGIIRARRIH